MYQLPKFSHNTSFSRIAILTSGGDSPGMNPAIRELVRTAHSFNIEVIGIHREYSGLLNEEFEPLNPKSVGAKMIHIAPNTSSSIVSKSIARAGGRSSYRGEIKIHAGAKNSKNTVMCDALLVDTISRSDTYPAIDVREDDVTMGHEATVSQVSEEQLFYLQSRGIELDEAMAMIVRGFIEPIAKELPMEYALELNKLIEMQMEGAVG